MDMFVARFFVTVAVAGVTLAAAYLALNPPAVPMAAGGRRPVQSRYEWLAPVALVDLVFLCSSWRRRRCSSVATTTSNAPPA